MNTTTFNNLHQCAIEAYYESLPKGIQYYTYFHNEIVQECEELDKIMEEHDDGDMYVGLMRLKNKLL